MGKTAAGLVCLPINLFARLLFLIGLDLFALCTFLRLSDGRLHPAHQQLWGMTVGLMLLTFIVIRVTGRVGFLRELFAKPAIRRTLLVVQVVLAVLLLFPSMVALNK